MPENTGHTILSNSGERLAQSAATFPMEIAESNASLSALERKMAESAVTGYNIGKLPSSTATTSTATKSDDARLEDFDGSDSLPPGLTPLFRLEDECTSSFRRGRCTERRGERRSRF
jgi:hypothetical protein